MSQLPHPSIQPSAFEMKLHLLFSVNGLIKVCQKFAEVSKVAAVKEVAEINEFARQRLQKQTSYRGGLQNKKEIENKKKIYLHRQRGLQIWKNCRGNIVQVAETDEKSRQRKVAELISDANDLFFQKRVQVSEGVLHKQMSCRGRGVGGGRVNHQRKSRLLQIFKR